MSDDSMPDFPQVAGHDRLSDDDRKNIAEAAWAQAHGNAVAFQQLCAEHMRGDINLFGNDPTAIRASHAAVPANGDRRLTATGGETLETGAVSVAGTPGREPAGQPAAEAWTQQPEPEPQPPAGSGLAPAPGEPQPAGSGLAPAPGEPGAAG